MLLLFLTFSVSVANPRKLVYTVANPTRGLLNRGKESKKMNSGSNPPSPPRCSYYREEIDIHGYRDGRVVTFSPRRT